MTNYYEYLGVPPDVDAAGLEKAYDAKVNELAKGIKGAFTDLERQAQLTMDAARLREVYRILCDDSERRAYDQNPLYVEESTPQTLHEVVRILTATRLTHPFPNSEAMRKNFFETMKVEPGCPARTIPSVPEHRAML